MDTADQLSNSPSPVKVDRLSSSGSGYEVVPENLDNDDENTIDTQDFIPLTLDALGSFFDVDGRIADGVKLREAVFNGGCTSDIRKKVWPFLFGVYLFSSTKREREDIAKTNYFNYQALKQKCQTLLGNVVSIVIDDIKYSPYANLEKEAIKNFENMAEIFALKQDIVPEFCDWYRVVDKDIPRTDIDHPYFQEDKDYKTKMRNILNTFGVFHPEIGYVQGMNDILTRFLVVMQSEAEAYWCFSNYMESVENDFSETGMVQKIEQVCNLLKDMEPDLYRHFEACNVSDLLFCHRWLLVSFQREFEYEDSIQYFEIVQSKHLTFDGHVALTAQDEQFKEEVLKTEGKDVARPSMGSIPYTLDVFVCVSVIMLKRQEFLKCKDASEIFTVACSIRGSLNLKIVRNKALYLFKTYCKNYTEKHCAPAKSSFIVEAIDHAAAAIQSVPEKVLNFPSKLSGATHTVKSLFKSKE